MASLRIVGIDPVTSGSNQLAAQGLDTVLINDIHGSTALNLVSTSGTIDLFTGGTAASNAVLSLGTGSATFNPNSQAAFNGVTIESGTGTIGLEVLSPATTNKTTLVVKQLGTAAALEVFGTGLALLQMGDSGTFLYNKTDSDMELYTSGAGLLTINSGATGGTDLTVDTNSAGQGSAITLTAGASTSGANNGGNILLTGGLTSSASVLNHGGEVSLTGGGATSATGSAQGGTVRVTGGSSTSGIGGAAAVRGGRGKAGGGSASLVGGDSTDATTAGGSVSVLAGGNLASPISDHFGSITLGNSNTRDIIIGGVTNAGIPGTITVTGQGTTGANSGGAISVVGGTTTDVNSSGGSVSLLGGTGAKPGGPVTVTGGTCSVSGNLGGAVSINGGTNSVSAISDNFGSITIGTATTKNIDIGGVSNSGVPGTITVTGQRTTANTFGGSILLVGGITDSTNSAHHGGGVSVTGGDSNSSAGGGKATLTGGHSKLGSGGNASLVGGPSDAFTAGSVVLFGGITASASYSGGDVIIDAGYSSDDSSPDRLGSIVVGTQFTGAITIGGSTSVTKSASGAAPSVTIQGFNHMGGSGAGLANGGNVVISGGTGTGQILSGTGGPGGSILIDPGVGGNISADGIISLFSQNGDTLSIGNGTVVPKVNIRDGYLSFTDTTSTSDSNPASGATTIKNSLYAKNTPDSWLLAFSNVLQDSFGILSIANFSLGIRVTFQHSATASLSQSFFLTGHPSTPFYLTVSQYAVNMVTVRGWNTSGVEVNLTTGSLVWQLLRMAEIA